MRYTQVLQNKFNIFKEQNARVTFKTEEIYTQFTEYAVKLEKDIPFISSLICQSQLISDVNANIQPLNKERLMLLNQMSEILHGRPNVALWWAQNLPPPRNEYVEADIKIPTELLRPGDPNYMMYDYDVQSNSCQFPKTQFPVRGSWKATRDIVFDQTSGKRLSDAVKAKDIPSANKLANMRAHGRMIANLWAFGRMTNVWEAILCALLNRERKCDYRDDLACDESRCGPRYGWETVCGQAIIQILYHMDTVPFTEGKGVVVFSRGDHNISTDVAPVLYALLGGILAEFGGTFLVEDARTYVAHVMAGTQAEASWMDHFLSTKGQLRGLWPVLLDKAPVLASLVVDDKCIPANEYIFANKGEYIYNRSKALKEMDTIYKGLPAYFRQWFDKTLAKVERCESKDHVIEGRRKSLMLRRIHMVMHQLTNCSLYLRTSLILAYEKGIQPRVYTIVPAPQPKNYFIGPDGAMLPLDMEYDGLLKRLAERVHEKYVKAWEEEFYRVGPERMYADSMTNRSGGVKFDSPELSATLRSMSNARLINFLLVLSKFYQLPEFVRLVKAPGACTFRYQIDRRARIVYMVSNARQLIGSLIYNGNLALKKEIPTIAQGKQRGILIDALLQLRMSGTPSTIKNTSDVSGMDASTLPTVAEMQARVLSSAAKDWKITNYFCFPEIEVDVLEPGRTPVRRTISAVTYAINYILAVQRPALFYLKDGFFSAGREIASDTFESGVLNTSEQHTILGDVLHDEIRYQWNHVLKKSKVTGDFIVMGDDTLEELRCDDTTADEYLEYTQGCYAELNYKIETSASRYYAIFLQQIGLLGMFVPQPDRISPWTEEKLPLHHMDPIANWQVFHDVLLTYGQRVILPDNLLGISRLMWNCLRTVRMNITDQEKWHGLSVTKTLVQLPYLMMSIPPHNGPLPMILWEGIGPRMNELGEVNEERVILSYPGDEITVPGGDANYGNWIRLLVGDYESLFQYRNVSALGKGMVNARKLTPDEVMRLGICWTVRELSAERVAHDLGFFLSIWYLEFSRTLRLTEIRKRELGTDILEMMERRLRAYYDIGEMARAGMAISELERRNLAVPMGLTLIAQPRVRLDDAILVRSERTLEVGLIDKLLERHMGRFKFGWRGVPMKTYRKIAVSPLWIDTSDDDVPLTPANVNVTTMPIMPGYNVTTSYGMISLRCDPIGMFLGTHDGILNPWGKTYGVRGDVKRVIEELASLGSRTNWQKGVLRLGMDAFGISRKYEDEIFRVVRNYDNLISRVEYRSFLNNATFMNLPTTIRAYQRGILRTTMMMSRLQADYMMLLFRDRLFSQPLGLCRKVVKLRGAIEGLLYLGTLS